MDQEESAIYVTDPPATEDESAQASLSDGYLGYESMDEARTPSNVQMRMEHQFQTQEQSTSVAEQKRSPLASPQPVQQPARASGLETISKEQCGLTLVALFQRFYNVLQKKSPGHVMLDRVTPHVLAVWISQKFFDTPETAAEMLQDLVHGLNTELQEPRSPSDDDLFAELCAGHERLLPSYDERREAYREMRAHLKKCNDKLPTSETLAKPQLKDVRQWAEHSIYKSAVNFTDYKNKCDALSRDASRCCDQLPDNIDS